MSDLKITPLWRVGSHRLFPTYQDAQDYVRKDAIRDYFQIIEKGVTEKRQAEMMQEMMEKLHALEGGRVLDI